MKAFCTLLFIALSAIITRGQGTVNFANTATTLIMTNFQANTGPISGAGNYMFGLYVGPFGSSPSSLSLVALATNSILPGRFNGDSAVAMPAGVQLSFQVRGWSSFAGNTFEQAYTYGVGNNFPVALVGESSLGFFTVPSSGSVVIFGTGPGQVGGFTLFPVTPEPSSYALALLGLSLFCGLRLRRPKA